MLLCVMGLIFLILTFLKMLTLPTFISKMGVFTVTKVKRMTTDADGMSSGVLDCYFPTVTTTLSRTFPEFTSSALTSSLRRRMGFMSGVLV